MDAEASNVFLDAYWMFMTALAIAVMLYPVTLPAAIVGVGCMVWRGRGLDPSTQRRSVWWLLVPFALPVLILLFGLGYYECHAESGTRRGEYLWIGTTILWAMLALHLPWTALLLVYGRGIRPFIVGLSLLQFGLSSCAFVSSWMAVTGDP